MPSKRLIVFFAGLMRLMRVQRGRSSVAVGRVRELGNPTMRHNLRVELFVLVELGSVGVVHFSNLIYQSRIPMLLLLRANSQPFIRDQATIGCE